MSIRLKGYRNIIVCSKGRFGYILNCRKHKQFVVVPTNPTDKISNEFLKNSLKSTQRYIKRS